MLSLSYYECFETDFYEFSIYCNRKLFGLCRTDEDRAKKYLKSLSKSSINSKREHIRRSKSLELLHSKFHQEMRFVLILTFVSVRKKTIAAYYVSILKRYVSV